MSLIATFWLALVVWGIEGIPTLSLELLPSILKSDEEILASVGNRFILRFYSSLENNEFLEVPVTNFLPVRNVLGLSAENGCLSSWSLPAITS